MPFTAATRTRVSTTPRALLVGNVIPVIGILWLSWRAIDVLMLYWLEAGGMVVLYCGAALFAQQPLVLDGRRFYLPGNTIRRDSRHQRWDTELTTIRIFDSWPPIYPRNSHLVGRALLWALGLVAVPLLIFPTTIRTALTLRLGLFALVLVMLQLYDLRREYFEKHRYEEMSPHMVLEIPARVLAVLFGMLVVLNGVGTVLLFVASLLFGPTLFQTVLTNSVVHSLSVTGLIGGKIVVEWAGFRAIQMADPSGLSAWLVPEDPRES